jgi:iron complex transport system substrate-binding protein
MTPRLILALLILALSALAQPRRIVSTSPSITEILFALGLGPRVVGVSEYCRFPAAVTQLPKVGTYLRPNSEQIARLQPDLVILHKLSNDVAARMTALGIHHLEVDRGGLPDLYTMIEKIGLESGVGPGARELIATIQSQLAALRSQSAALPRLKVLFVVGRQLGTLSNLVTVGSDSYLNELIRIAGGRNVLDDFSLSAYPRIAMETVVRLDPDVLIDVADPMMGSPSPNERQKEVVMLWAQQTGLAAVRSKRIHALDSEAFVVPGPRVVEVARSLLTIFHPREAK